VAGPDPRYLRGAGLLVALVALLAAAWLGLARADAPIVQPIAFDHARHAQEGLACTDCHAQADHGSYATLPRLARCMLCHKEAQGTHADEPKLREYARRNEEVPWVEVNRLPGHVHFSHVAHVRFGALDCSTCHGDMAHATAPPPRSQIDGLTMGRCMDCHAERHASNDCIACHK
jgi:hypothetical protein